MRDDEEQAARRLAERVLEGDTRALARAISLVENDAAGARMLLSACFASSSASGRQSLRVGITGAPGAGKSTLVDGLARAWREAGARVGVLAVDPTSPFTGGAVLGDRIRMSGAGSTSETALAGGIFFRSMATRGALGGLARAAADAALLMEAGGREVVLIETVGVGQDEVDVARLADVTVVVLVPGMGDDVQSLKAGLMEIADLFVINKADHEGADRLEGEIRSVQSLPGSRHIAVPILRTVATEGTGVTELRAAIESLRNQTMQRGRIAERRAAFWRLRFEGMLLAALRARLASQGLDDAALARHAERIAAGAEDPYRLTEELVRRALGPDVG
ncbi:methylmalonyl Co-A mutase-associated GTPase MeaB [Silvibacterium dinghuense]|uniref:Methylmalonyl Co-A mutase-associated GTPase MeaB n=1 Tax=Silvibacterium dinghuense TaxID=1560006 RepID=A0A4Q1SH10_9BACT|nr:methylmalonyl Co-A mutase-associated GTPase MeaB [Silvibacterium dinghuense]RXS96841.1 methylmalonyl Co-A mutase-associated GTPase MeaB [Silvibacterium dinghuense]GGG94084.1 GTPase [Silvibacterium dinghuense]